MPSSPSSFQPSASLPLYQLRGMGRWEILIPGCSFLGIKRELLIQKNTLKETNWVAFYKFHSLKWFCKSLVHQSQVTVALSPVVQREGKAI